jgi:SSS family solute:Na+ symporter
VSKPIVTFGPGDYLALVLFISALLYLGFSAKMRSNTVVQFLSAGRQLSLPLFVASLVSMWYGEILGASESAAAYGVGAWILFGVPYYVFAILYAFYFAGRVRNADQISIPERLHLRFGKWPALFGAALLFLLAVPAAHLLCLGVLIQSLTGWGLGLCVLIGLAVATCFVYKGGLLADARASIIAFVMMYVGFIVMLGWCLVHHPLAATIGSIHDKNLLKWDGGTGILYVFSLFVLGAWTFVDPGFHQRVASSATPTVGKRGVLISVFFWLIFDVLSLTTALYAIALYPNLQGLDGIKALQLYPMFAQQVLPQGLKALFFCGMLGAIMSATVAYGLASGATLGREIFARFRPAASDETVNRWSRWGILVGCLVAAGLAIKIESVIDLWTAWAGAVVGALLIPVGLAYLKKAVPINAVVMCLSILAAFTVAIIWMCYGRMHGNEYLEVVFARTSHGLKIVMPNSDASGDAVQGVKMSIGTLMPGLAISALVIALGSALTVRRRENA